MATISLQFPSPINISVKKGDVAYYTDPTNNYSNSGFAINNGIITIGEIQSITDDGTNVTMVCEWFEENSIPSATSFIFFSKNNLVHLSRLAGYYGSVKFENDSKDKAELFSVGCEISESSK